MNCNYPVLSKSEESVAPWNQKDPPPISVDCSVSYSMSKSMPVLVGSYDVIDNRECFDNTNLIGEFNTDKNALGLPDLLAELHKLSEEKVSKLQDELALVYSPKAKAIVKKELEYYKRLSEASQGWIVDDLDVVSE